MHYYEVYVASQRFHGNEPLTYASEQPLSTGIVVSLPLQRQSVLGIVGHEVGKPRFATKPISTIVHDKPLPASSLAMLTWLQCYYPAPLGFLAQLFTPVTLMQQSRKAPVGEVLVTARQPAALPLLTAEQQTAVHAITQTAASSFLLHGDTGTGKTRVYVELAADALARQQSVIVLTPEIGLTAQLAGTFQATFPGQVVTVHSTLTPAQRRSAWKKIHESTTPLVIIGPRSALFSPVHQLGYIIIDEFHDSAYKQEQAPYYVASRVAAQLAHLQGAKLILGSATPPVSDYYAFEAKQLPILRMQTSAKTHNHGEPHLEVVDLRERKQFARSSWLSDTLIAAINDALNEKSQSLVFLNRRGTARLVMCQNCGWQAACPRCDLPLTYHGDSHILQCHTCGHQESAPASCPICRSTDIVFKSVGTKTLVSELQKLFPKARVQRFDSDTDKAGSLEQHYESVRDGDVDIIVGTQMLSKGLDLPNLSTVGVVVADTSLYFPDYTANERTYQLITQVMGRVGRGHRAGTTIIQTYHPDSPAIQNAVNKDYTGLYESELKERELFRFPPYYFLLKLSISRASQKAAQKAAESLYEILQNANLPIELSGPTPAFTERVNNQYRWQIIVKARNRSRLIDVLPLLPSGWTYDLDPSNLL